MTEADLHPLCREWQRRLHLQDWIITVRLVGTREIGDHQAAGTCHFLLDKKVARIDLLRQEDYPPDALVPYDVEQILVHELLHLWTAPFGPADDEKEDGRARLLVTAEEQMVDTLATAFVDLKWKGPGLALERKDYEKRNRDPEPPQKDQTDSASNGGTRSPFYKEREDRPEGQGVSARQDPERRPGPV